MKVNYAWHGFWDWEWSRVPVRAEEEDALCFRGTCGVFFLGFTLCDEMVWYTVYVLRQDDGDFIKLIFC